jgi:predicted ATPase
MIGSSVQSGRRFREISIKGFRRLNDVQLALRPLSVLIGKNGIGKTSMLDVFSLLASSARGGLNSAISDLSGLSACLTYDRADRLCLGISMEVEHVARMRPFGSTGKAQSDDPLKDDSLKYELCLRPQGAAYIIEKEMLTQQREPKPKDPFKHINSQGSDVRYYEVDQRHLVRPTWEHNPLETSLCQVPKMFREPEEFRNRLASSTFYHVLNVEPRSPVRLPQPLRPATLPGRNGEDLVSCLFSLRESDRDRFEAIEDALRAAFPGFQRLDFPLAAAGTLALSWRDTHFSKPLYTHQMSEGMLRFLWLATLLQSPGLTALTLLDEPEVSLHPELLSLLAGLLREASQRTQVVVATHSDRLIRFLRPAEVVAMDSDQDGLATLTWADELNLGEWLKEYTLDELWSNGRLGVSG